MEIPEVHMLDVDTMRGRPVEARANDADDDALVPEAAEVAPRESPLDPVPLVAHPPAIATTRAGRNLPTAVAVGLGLGALVIASLVIEKVAFLGVLGLAVSVGAWELSHAVASRGIRLPVVPVVVGGVATDITAYVGGPTPMVSATVLTALVVVAWRGLQSGPGLARDTTAGLFATLYIPFLAGYTALMLRADDGADRILVFALLVAASDIGGYAAGATLGRHPMAPTVSPKKSWEGFAGSVLACVLVGATTGPLLVSTTWWQGAALGLCVVVTATLGDLGESLIKRDLAIKDMGSLLPGHGGVMDRLDSLLPSAPAVYLGLALMVGSG